MPSVAALFAIVATGRHPCSIFDFNVEFRADLVCRLLPPTARSAPDRYPPFTLRTCWTTRHGSRSRPGVASRGEAPSSGGRPRAPVPDHRRAATVRGVPVFVAGAAPCSPARYPEVLFDPDHGDGALDVAGRPPTPSLMTDECLAARRAVASSPRRDRDARRPKCLRLRRGQREGQRLAVRARSQRVRGADRLAELERDRVVGDRPAPRQQVQRRRRRADVVVRRAGVGRVARPRLQRLRQRERAVDQVAGRRADSGRRRSAARRPRSRSRSPSWTRRTSARRPA